MTFLAGFLVGGAFVYAWLRWECERAFERLGRSYEDEINRS